MINRSLYKEGMQQLKTIGILNLIIYSVFALLLPIINVIENNNRLMYGLDRMEMPVTFLEMNILIFTSFFIFAPFYTLYLFKFLNSRKQSDFYHAIPHTRKSLFLSFFAAIMSWLIISIVVSSVLSSATLLIVSNMIKVEFGLALNFILNMTVASFLVVSAILLAYSITGTDLSTLIVSLMILFLPRIFIITFLNKLSGLFIIRNVEVLSFLNTNFNIPVGTLLPFYSNSAVDPKTSYISAIYTFVLGFIYLLLAYVLFKRRASETAAKSSPNRVMQAVYRISFTSLICLPAAFMLYDNIFSNSSFNNTGIIILYVIALILYFIYELITTRSARNLVKAIPGIGILVLVNAAIILALFGVSNWVFSFQPEADQIKSVSIVEGDYYKFSETQLDLRDAIKGIEIEDAKVKEIVSESLKNSIKFSKDSNEHYNYTANSSQEYIVKITTSKTSKVRNIGIPAIDVEYMFEVFSQDERVNEKLKKILDFKHDVDIRFKELNGVQSKLLFNEYRKDINFISVLYKDKAIGYFEIQSGNNNFIIPLLSDAKNTLDLYFKFRNEQSKEHDKEILNALEMAISSENETIGYMLETYVFKEYWEPNYIFDKDEAKKLYANLIDDTSENDEYGYINIVIPGYSYYFKVNQSYLDDVIISGYPAKN